MGVDPSLPDGGAIAEGREGFAHPEHAVEASLLALVEKRREVASASEGLRGPGAHLRPGRS